MQQPDFQKLITLLNQAEQAVLMPREQLTLEVANLRTRILRLLVHVEKMQKAALKKSKP